MEADTRSLATSVAPSSQLDNSSLTDMHIAHDGPLISVPIPQAEIDQAWAEAPVKTDGDAPPTYDEANPTLAKNAAGKKCFFSSLKAAAKSKGASKPTFRMVKMAQSEYTTYFAKDERGQYICTVPRETGEWKTVLRARLEDSELQSSG